MSPQERARLEQAFRNKGGDPSQAIPWETPDGNLIWACPLNENRVILTTETNSTKVIPMGSLKNAYGKPAAKDDFPKPATKEDPKLEIQLAFSKNPCAAHNGKPFLCWYKQSIKKLQGILLPSERREEEAEASSLKHRLRKMTQPPLRQLHSEQAPRRETAP